MLTQPRDFKPYVQSHAAPGSAKLSVRDVSKCYGIDRKTSIEALLHVSFDVRQGEVCALLGPSGCGKSTVLRIVAGLEEPSTGTILLDGEPIDGPDRKRGMVFQRYTSFEWMTVLDNIEYGMRINGVRRADRRARALHFLELVRLTKFKDAYPRQLSGGMQQRVAIARTLANDPAIVLMDEPFGALDAETRWKMQELLIDIVESSKATVLLVTHDLEEAIFLADRIVFMSRGPGSVREKLVAEFKHGHRFSSHEEMKEADGYRAIERKLMHLMREESGGEL